MTTTQDLVLTAEGVSVQFGGLQAVSDMGVQIRSGEVAGVIGPNGAGKSTFFNALAGLQPIDSGHITLCGRDVTRLSASERARLGLARTFQLGSIVPDLTAMENVVLGLDQRRRAGGPRTPARAIRAEATNFLEKVGLGKYRDVIGSSLAEGVKRQIELMRAVAAGGDVVLLDEPGAGLGDADRDQLATIIRSLADEGHACLITDHSTELVFAVCDHVQVMNFGAQLTAGTPEEIRRHPAVMDAYLGTSEKEVDRG